MKLSLIESRLFGRICYGFKRDNYGFVEIVPEQAEVVKTIFRMYREENSLEDIQKHLLSRSISSPSGKAKWSRDVLNKLLIMEKDIAKLAGILGHSSIDTTRIYIMSTGAELRRRMERLGLLAMSAT